MAEFLTSDKTRKNPKWSALYLNAAEQHRAVATEIGRDDGDAIWRDDADAAVQGRRVYARLFYIAHLHQGRDWQRLIDVIDAGAYGRGKVASDPSTLLFAGDLNLAIEAAENTQALGALWKCKLLRSTMGGYADGLPAKGYAALAAVGRTNEAFRLVELVADAPRQTAAFAALARSVPGEAIAQSYLRRGLEALPQLEAAHLGEVTTGLLEAARVVKESAGALTHEVQQALYESATQLLRHEVGGPFARSAVVLLWTAGARDQAQALGSAMAEAGRVRELCGLIAEIGEIDEARRVAAMIPEPTRMLDALGAIAATLMDTGREDEARSTLTACCELVEKAEDPDGMPALLATLGDAELACGDRESAARTYRQALELTKLDRFHIDHLSRLARALCQAGDLDSGLKAFQCVYEMAIKEISEREIVPGHGYPFSFFARSVGTLASDLDQPEAALALARKLEPWEQYPIVGAAVVSIVRSGDLERAMETMGIFAELAAASPVRIQITTEGEKFVDESDCQALIAQKFADRGDWARALELASKISSDYARYQAYSELALRRYDAGLVEEAAELVARVMSELRLQNAREGKEDGLSTAIDFLLDGGDVAEAEEASASIQTIWMRVSAGKRIANALVERGEYERAETFAKSFPPSNLASALVAIAGKQVVGQRAEAEDSLDRARKIAHTIQEGSERSEALREICLAYHQLPGREQAAQETMHEAMLALQQADKFRLRPTPWPDMFLLMAKMDHWQPVQGYVTELVDFDPFDGCAALLKLAEYAWRSGDLVRVDDVMKKAKDAAARTTFAPMQSQCYAQIVQLYAKMGYFEQARAGDLIELANRNSQRSAMLYVVEELANAGRIGEAYEAAEANELASLLLVDATLRAADRSRAVKYVSTFPESSAKAQGLGRVASAFEAAGYHQQALALLSEALALPPGEDHEAFVVDAARRYVAMGEGRLAVALVGGEWRRAPSRWNLIQWLGYGRPLLLDFPLLGVDIYRSFRWVEEFIAG
jgi:tetratricopeptide (TPR) repeat protein